MGTSRVAGALANDLIAAGDLPPEGLRRFIRGLKPEAAYFSPEGGERAGLFVVEMEDSSQVADIAERFFFGLNARIEMTPVMSADDLRKGLSGMQGIIQRYS